MAYLIVAAASASLGATFVLLFPSVRESWAEYLWQRRVERDFDMRWRR